MGNKSKNKKVTVKEIIVLQSALNSVRIPLPAKLGFRMGGLKRQVAEHFENYNENREKIIREKYGEEKEDGSIQVPKEKMEDYNKELKDLMKEEVTLVNPPTFKLSEFVDQNDKELSLTADFFEGMADLIEE